MRWCLRTTPTVRNEMNKSQKAYKQDQLKIQVDHCQIQVTWSPEITR